MRLGLITGGLLFVAVAAAEPAASGRTLAGTCAACHGTDGVSVGPATPTLAGVNGEYFVEVMQGFKSGTRHATVMNRIAKGYADDEIKSMATFFGGKKYVAHRQQANAAKVAKGKAVHKSNCEKCHEDGGRTSEDGGILAGQWMPYLRYTMADFTAGKSEMPKKMKAKVQKLKAADIEALIHYYGSQK
jgi:sulfide dehydrogenase cytochrome subunit